MNAQLKLFSPEREIPKGLQYTPDFISPATEQELISKFATLPLQPFQFGLYEGKRRVVWFGYQYDYSKRRLVEAEPIPDWLHNIVSKVAAAGGRGTEIGQVLCTEYDTGTGIGWHRDKPHFDRIFGLSLGSACRFRFRKNNGTGWERYTLDAQPRSLYLMEGPSRTDWEHSIPGVAAPRYSITFRTMRLGK